MPLPNGSPPAVFGALLRSVATRVSSLSGPLVEGSRRNAQDAVAADRVRARQRAEVAGLVQRSPRSAPVKARVKSPGDQSPTS